MKKAANKRCSTCRHDQTCTLTDTGRILHICELDHSYIGNARLEYGRCENWRGAKKRNDRTGVCEVCNGTKDILPERELTAEQTGDGTLVQTASGSAV